jgi:hypothetical protein
MPSWSSLDSLPFKLFDPSVQVSAIDTSRKSLAEWHNRDEFPGFQQGVNVQLPSPKIDLLVIQVPAVWSANEEVARQIREAHSKELRDEAKRPPRYRLQQRLSYASPMKPSKLFMGTG